MTLTLSQKSLLFLLVFAFVIGFLMAILYQILTSISTKRLKTRWVKILFRLLAECRDCLFFALFGVMDAILLFVFNAGRVRFGVFVFNLLGFLCARAVLHLLFAPVLNRWKRNFRIRKEK